MWTSKRASREYLFKETDDLGLVLQTVLVGTTLKTGVEEQVGPSSELYPHYKRGCRSRMDLPAS